MPMYNLIEYSDNYSKPSKCLWQYYSDEANATLTDSESFKIKARITRSTTDDDNTKYVNIALPLVISNFWRTLKMPLINCEINSISSWSENIVISSATGEAKFVITDTKLYVQTVTLLTQDNAWTIKIWF